MIWTLSDLRLLLLLCLMRLKVFLDPRFRVPPPSMHHFPSVQRTFLFPVVLGPCAFLHTLTTSAILAGKTVLSLSVS